MATSIFVNLAVKDLDRSVGFFQALGYRVNEKYTNDKAACLVIGETIYIMLLVEEFFGTFTEKEIVDATKATEVLTALSCDSREAVDDVVAKALAAGARESRDPQDNNVMYSRAIEDLDGHIWEFFWMDEEAGGIETSKEES